MCARNAAKNTRSNIRQFAMCTAPKPPPVRDETCTLCGKIFQTKSDLSQHERHEHPVARNAAHAGGAIKGEQAPRKLKVFMEEEENRMLELEVRFKGERNVANAMLPFMPDKTGKQIRDKNHIVVNEKKRNFGSDSGICERNLSQMNL